MSRPKGSEIPPEVIQIAEDIKSMKIRGAGKIARSAAQALVIAAEKYDGPPQGFSKYIRNVGVMLVKTRPTAVSLPNAVFYVLYRVEGLEGEEARRRVINAGKEFIELSLTALDRLADIGSKLIQDGDVILTHCHSTAVVRVLQKARQRGVEFEVYNTETRPRFQGRITARQLLESGIRVTHITDSAVRSAMRKITKVIVGADTITSDGHLVNKVGTSQIAIAAYEAGVPFYSATESIKFSPASFAGGDIVIEERSAEEVVNMDWLKKRRNTRVLNPAFDITDPELIHGFITELGLIPPRAASLVIREMFGLKSGYLQLKLIEEEAEWSY